MSRALGVLVPVTIALLLAVWASPVEAKLRKRNVTRVKTSVNVELASDYLYRGYSLSDEDYSASGKFAVEYRAAPGVTGSFLVEGTTVANADLEAKVGFQLQAALPNTLWMYGGARQFAYLQVRQPQTFEDLGVNATDYPDLEGVIAYVPLGDQVYSEVYGGFGVNLLFAVLDFSIHSVADFEGGDYKKLYPNTVDLSARNYFQIKGNLFGLDFVYGRYDGGDLSNIEVNYTYNIGNFYTRYTYQRWDSAGGLDSILATEENNDRQVITMGVKF